MLLGGLNRSHLAVRQLAGADDDARRPFRQPAHELVMNLFLQQQPRTGGADLAGVEEGGVQRVVDGGVEVGVGADDVRVLPPSSSPMRLKLPLAARMMLAPAWRRR